MSTPKETAALTKQIKSFARGAKSGSTASVAKFFAATADFRGSKGMVRGAAKIATADKAALKMRGAAATASMKWLSSDIAIVDSVMDSAKGRAWFTELWQKSGKSYQIVAARTRAGSSKGAFAALNRMSAAKAAGADGVSAVANKEEAALRKNFKAFREAFNKGDSKKMVQLWSKTCDAAPAFSFLNGRSQIINGQMAVGAKADRMNPGTLVSNPAGATIVAGEPKTVRFMTPKIAIVDGTASIANIPNAHGFAPKAMKGVYTDFWKKSGTKWEIESSRAWF